MYRPVDWPKIILTLQREGMDHAQQAREIGYGRRAIGRYLAGSEPAYSKGEQMLEIYMSVTGSTVIPRQ